MSALEDEIFRRFMKRLPTAEEYKQMDELFLLMPKEMRASPAAVFQVVIQIAFLRQQHETLKDATWEAQQRVHADLPHRIDDAALKALNKIRDTLPIDASDSFRRTSKIAIFLIVVCAVVFGCVGYKLGIIREQRAAASLHAVSEVEFNRCVDAAAGQFTTSHHRVSRKGPVSNDIVRDDLRACAAEYADRMAASY